MKQPCSVGRVPLAIVLPLEAVIFWEVETASKRPCFQLGDRQCCRKIRDNYPHKTSNSLQVYPFTQFLEQCPLPMVGRSCEFAVRDCGLTE